MRRYEGMFILRDGLEDETQAGQIEAIRSEIGKLKGVVTSVTRLGKNVFARPMKKRRSGYYFVAIFDMEPDKIEQLNERCRSNKDICRFQIVATLGAPASGAE